jgi:predicted protein tyrosine phosphatase
MNPRHPNLLMLGYSEAAMFLQNVSAPDVVAIISIHGRREFGVEANVEPRLDLTFDDVEVPQSDDVMSDLRATSRKRWAAENGLVERAPTVVDAASIIHFAERLRDCDGIVLCHCGGGMSRAPAAALICLVTWRGPGSESDCVAEICRFRKGAVPHVGLIRFADELLGREGRLVGAFANARR